MPITNVHWPCENIFRNNRIESETIGRISQTVQFLTSSNDFEPTEKFQLNVSELTFGMIMSH